MTSLHIEVNTETTTEQSAGRLRQGDKGGFGPQESSVKLRPQAFDGMTSDTSSLLALSGSLTGAQILSKAPERRVQEGAGTLQPGIDGGKRAFDVVFALCILICVLPFLLVCAIIGSLESPGPVLFRQRRIGRGGKPFTIYKLRTMVTNADEVLARHLKENPAAAREWAADHKLRQDPRVTRIGKVMRRLSIDEFPQLMNVLKGDMSIVGPRPIVSAEIPLYGNAFRVYCAVRPGLTGLWQVSGRNDTGYSQRVALDQKYVASCSPKLDASILARTFRAVVAGSGAY